ncbi:hypothetical protein TBK1r_46000 [Stieleria magnilauensis]|uniref:DUF4325 domain-containing protein n=1 Tax=Stieleria magnilauensis TaxID=2527963 RepID=A0ABX5XUX5_9BACT|nr:hypothetical protein TBK1r_46000 [Planctomycetes bacterium TBK1r]
MVHTIQIAKLLESDFLQGRPLGRKHFPMLCAELTSLPDGGIVLLDFASVRVVTGSWINEAIVPLMGWLADQRNDLFAVFMNLDEDCVDELRLISEWTHTCFLLAKGSKLPTKAALAGELDPGQRDTLLAVVANAGVTGAELERLLPDAGVKATAWNNRLKDLFQKRLLRREKHGREQRYWPIVREVVLNG